jgi:hypothetical protein
MLAFGVTTAVTTLPTVANVVTKANSSGDVVGVSVSAADQLVQPAIKQAGSAVAPSSSIQSTPTNIDIYARICWCTPPVHS